MVEQLDFLTLSAVVSPARTSARPAAAQDSTAPARACGSKCSESCERCGPLGSLLKTCLRLELEALTGSSTTWRRQTTPLGRSWWVLTTSAPRTDANARGSSPDEWPTPTAIPYGSSNNGSPGDGRETYATAKNPSLETLARSWPTPHGMGTPDDPHGSELSMTVAVAAGSSTSERTTKRSGLWPTATAGDAKASGSRTTAESGAHPGISLTDVAVHGLSIDDKAGRMWCTPTQRDWKDSPGTVRSDDGGGAMTMPRQVFADGPQDPASDSTDGRPPAPSPSLNADWVLQLMGYPRTWARLSTARALLLPETLSSPTSPSALDEC